MVYILVQAVMGVLKNISKTALTFCKCTYWFNMFINLRKHYFLLQLSIELFPSTIRYLSMRGCVMMRDLDPRNSYFRNMYAHIPHIKVIRIQ
jgi:hypothetical protein